MSREELLTFDMLERRPLITDQQAYEFQWDKVDALYQFVDMIPAWVVDDEIFALWSTGREDAPREFPWLGGEKGCMGAGADVVIVTCSGWWWSCFCCS